MSRNPEEDARATPWIAGLIVLVTLVLFWPAGGHDFVDFDDAEYLTANPAVQRGLSLATVGWALTSDYMGTWHPLTWLSHACDWALFGAAPRGHHLVNVALHAFAAALLFLVLRAMTQSTWRPAFVALVFAVHPLHVESVAWVSERKDVLSGLFWMLTLGAWVRWTRRPGPGRYALVVLAFALGLMAKPMLVTLPFVLLLLDVWPLGRIGKATVFSRALIEKAPLFALAAAASVVTLVVQTGEGAVKTVEEVPLAARAANVPVAYATYLIQSFWPTGLAIPYPYVVSRPAWQVGGSIALLALLSAGAWWLRRVRPYVTVGWLWFVGTLVPVIGLVQVGSQARADRYTYLPMIGLAIAVAWGIPSLFPARLRWRRPLLVVLSVASLLAAAAAARAQLGYWRNSETLFRRAIAVTEQNKVAEFNLAYYLDRQGRWDEAVPHYRAALRIRPDAFDARYNLGHVLFRLERFDEAADVFRELLRERPGLVAPMAKLALILATRDSPGTADAEEAVRLATRAVDASGAEPEMLEILKTAQFSLARRLDHAGRRSEAVEHYRAALAAVPGDLDARWNLANTLYRLGRLDEAVPEYRTIVAAAPEAAEPLTKLAAILATHPNPAARRADEAVRLAERAVLLTGRRDPLVLSVMASAYSEAGRAKESVEAACAALGLLPEASAGLRQEITRRLRGAPCR